MQKMSHTFNYNIKMYNFLKTVLIAKTNRKVYNPFCT